MARIRIIKPDFFQAENVAGLSPLARLLYIGLWTIADSGGVVSDTPAKIKLSLLPYDACSIDSLISELIVSGLVKKVRVRHMVTAEQATVLLVDNFNKLQKIDKHNEGVSRWIVLQEIVTKKQPQEKVLEQVTIPQEIFALSEAVKIPEKTIKKPKNASKKVDVATLQDLQAFCQNELYFSTSERAKEKSRAVIAYLDTIQGNNEYSFAFEMFAQMRIELKKPLTYIAAKDIVLTLAGYDVNVAIEMLEQSTANRWQAVYELKNNKTDTKTNNGNSKRYIDETDFVNPDPSKY